MNRRGDVAIKQLQPIIFMNGRWLISKTCLLVPITRVSRTLLPED